MVINYWAVLVAALAQWLLGWAWYGPLFGKRWMALSGHSMEGGKKSDATKAMIWGLVGALVMASVLSWVISIVPNLTVACGALTGAILWLGFIAMTMINSVLYERKSMKLFVLNSGYYLVALVVMGLILASWR